VQRVEAFVADQRLRQLGVALDDVDEVVDDPAFSPHHEIEIAQADIEIDHNDPLAALRQRSAQGSSRCRLSDTSLPRCHDQHLRHPRSPLLKSRA
jgi:nitrate reductase beta subunit